MSRLVRWMHGREYMQLLLNWRWLVLFISIPISLVIELLEGHGVGLHLLDEVILDGLVLPFTTWIVLTFAARRIAVQYEREVALEQRQQFTRQLAEHHEYKELIHFLVRFPASLLPIEQAILEIFDQNHQRLTPVAEWSTPATLSREPYRHYLVLTHNNIQVGGLKLSFAPDRVPTAAQKSQLHSYAPDIAAALARAIEAHLHAEQVYREAQAYERRRITQELHDSLAQQVFYLHIGLDQLVDDVNLAKYEAVQRKLASMRDVAADVYEQIRNNLSILRAWEQVNLTEAVTELARVTAHNASMSIVIDVQGEPGWLSPHTCEQIYSVVREALHNIVKHASARHVQLALSWSDERLVIQLVDDGVGFEPQKLAAEGHYGLVLMRETIEALHGAINIESSPGQGTCLHITIPIRLPDTDLFPSKLWPQQLHSAFGVL